MTDYSRDRLGPQDEDRLPWLEPVEEEYEESGVGTGRLIVWLVAALMLLALVVGGYFWLRGNDKATSGEGALIKAPDAYYKERPGETTAPVGEDEIVYSASKGNEVESVIDTSGAAETPVNIDRPHPEAPVRTAAIPPSSSAPAASPAPPRRNRRRQADPDRRPGTRPAGGQARRGEARAQAGSSGGGPRPRAGIGRIDGAARRLLQPGQGQCGVEDAVGPLLLPVEPHPVGGAGAVGRQDTLPAARQWRQCGRHLPPAQDRGRELLGDRIG
nr:hypothetical protein [Rhizorhabdus wittichii]